MARILLSIILICWFASLLVLFIDLIWWDKKLGGPLLAGSILQFIPFSLLLQKKLSASSFISAGIYILLTTALATVGNGIHDYVMMVYPIIIMFAGLMSQRRGLFFSTLLTLRLLPGSFSVNSMAGMWFKIHLFQAGAIYSSREF